VRRRCRDVLVPVTNVLKEKKKRTSKTLTSPKNRIKLIAPPCGGRCVVGTKKRYNHAHNQEGKV
jgi:hypothetical protein